MLRQCSGPQVEQRVLVELTDGRTMRTLYVVRENLQLRLGRHLSVLRQQQRLVGLFRIGLLRGKAYHNLAVEDTPAPAIKDSFVQLVAIAVGLGVIDSRLVVDKLARFREIQTIPRAFAALTIKDNDPLISHNRSTQGNGVR